jgi:four helix bundle protein
MQEKNGYHDLIVWQKSMNLVIAVYQLVKEFPREEAFGLSAQMKRAAVSIPSNIAEGYRRSTIKDRKHFLTMAYGSTAELETQVEIAKQLKFGNQRAYAAVDTPLIEVSKMLNKMSS